MSISSAAIVQKEHITKKLLDKVVRFFVCTLKTLELLNFILGKLLIGPGVVLRYFRFNSWNFFRPFFAPPFQMGAAASLIKKI